MSRRASPLLSLALGCALVSSIALGACSDDGGSSGSASTGSQGGDGPSTSGGGDGTTGTGFNTSSGEGGGTGQELEVDPVDVQTITVPIGGSTPTVAYTASANGQPVNAGWSVDRGNLGSVTAGPGSTTTFTPSGTTGGLVKVRAGFAQQTVERDVFIQLQGTTNGLDPNNPLHVAQVPTSVADLTAGGGVNGVGGDGLGPAVTDGAILTALDNPVGDGVAQGLTLIYPYDKTVWPRGLLAPNLMWRWSTADADAIKIELETTEGSFSWSGTFGRPAILTQTGGNFMRHPIPQDIWAMATNTAGGVDRLTVHLTVLKNGQAYGPISQTWTIAPARLSGTIYYNSYGTQLAKNYEGAVGGDGLFGGAVLSIRAGDPGPGLAAGSDVLDTGCRVCHSVSADGSRMVVQRGGTQAYASGLYDLTPTSITESDLLNAAEFPGLTPDGSAMLAPSGQLYPLPGAASALPATGLTDVSTQLGTPSFSPAGDAVVFNMLTSGVIANPKQKLVVMSYDPMTYAFSNPLEIVDYTGSDAEIRPGWPAFFPDGSSVVFNKQFEAGADGNNLGDLRTRKGALGELSWASAAAAGPETLLNALNGRDENGNSYLPSLPAPFNLACTGDAVAVGAILADHSNDVQLNYEPTVNPVASGGYAWVVFTSRRLYGSVAEIPPFCSDPRGVDLIQNVTTKKLWVAAIDVTGQPGDDASHPAFYLPGQELLAGNSRGFWALDPCKDDGEGCEAGDECCNGYCQPDGDGDLVCSDTPPTGDCSQPQEICTTAADCCDATNLCIGGFCSVQPPQ